MSLPERVLWPQERLGEALDVLARASGLPGADVESSAPGTHLDDQAVGRWVEAEAARVGVEAQAVSCRFGEVDQLVREGGPAVLRVGDGFLLLVGATRRWARVVGSDLQPTRLPRSLVGEAVAHAAAAGVPDGLEQVIEAGRIRPARRARVREFLLRETLGGVAFPVGWLLRLRPETSFWRQLATGGVTRRAGLLLVAHVVGYGLLLVSWWMVGRGALQGSFDPGWLVAWALLLLTLVPLRMWTTWLQGEVAIGAGTLLKRRLLAGALAMEPDAVRRQGVGQLLGRVLESEAVEALSLSGGFMAVVAVLELTVAVVVLALGASGLAGALALVGWVGLTLTLAWRYRRARQEWTLQRLALTNDLVEAMVGHRTRLAQESPHRWHQGEDDAVSHYLDTAALLDLRLARLTALVPRGWLVVGLLTLAPGLVSGQASLGALAVSVGGILLAARSLWTLVWGAWALADASVAWEQVAPLYSAATSQGHLGGPAGAVDGAGGSLTAHELVFRYGDRGQPVIRGASLAIEPGDRVLLEGPSGGGKSTLAALLVGLREPEAGVVLLGGLDLPSLGGAGWRRRVAVAPQFHENHVLTETLAFNLLMGRQWPPGPGDLEEAERLCRELGLGDVLDRMPAGLMQVVGESGWQLSHGERSRLYVARALLQGADLVVLDESFASLDPHNLKQALECVVRRARTLMVIAHP